MKVQPSPSIFPWQSMSGDKMFLLDFLFLNRDIDYALQLGDIEWFL
jgi:hypothetical protein